MKSNLKALPYPVLSRGDDFLDSHFQCTVDLDIEVEEDIEYLVLSYNFMLSNDSVMELIEKGSASFALDVACSDTLFRDVIREKSSVGKYRFSKGQLYGKVQIEPFVVVTKPVIGFFSADLNPEFGTTPFSLQPGDTIAVDEIHVKSIEFEKLKFESLIRVQTADEIPTDTYSFDLQSDLILILMGKDFRRVWEAFRQEKDKAPFLAMSVYKDLVLCALDYIAKNSEESDQFKWARAFKLKLSSLGRKISENADLDDLNSHAQQLVSKLSLQRLLKYV